MLFDHLSGKYDRRSSQLGVSFVLLPFSLAQLYFINSSSIRLRWQREIFDDLRSHEVVTDKQTRVATTKHTANFAFRAICGSCRTIVLSGAGPVTREWKN